MVLAHNFGEILNLNSCVYANSATWHGPLEIAADCTIKNGTIRNNSLTGDALVTITGGNVVFEDVTFDCSNCTPEALVRIAFGSKANVTFKGNCRFLAANKNVDAVYVDYCTSGKVMFDSSFTGYVGGKVTLAYESTHPNDDPAVEVFIAGSGTFENAIALDGGAYSFNNSSVSISGGRFAVEPNPATIADGSGLAYDGISHWSIVPDDIGGEPSAPVWTVVDGELTGVSLNGFTDVVIPDSVTKIGARVFYGCDELRTVTIPDSVTEIGDYAFYGCKALRGVTIPKSVKNIGIWAFAACTGISEIDIPGSVTNLGAYAVSNNRNLTNVVMRAGLKSIQAAAFLNTGLFDVVIPDTVAVVGNSAFNYCYSLTNVVVGQNVSAMGGMVFYKCTSLESVAFRGNAPVLYWSYPLGVANGDSEIYKATPASLVTYVTPTSTGWNGAGSVLPEEWPVGDDNARKIAYYDAADSCWIVMLNPQGGVISEKTIFVDKGAAVGDVGTPVREGYRFDGWYTAASGGQKVTAATKVTGNVTLYAHWTLNSFTVVLNKNDGTGTKEEIIFERGKDCILPGATAMLKWAPRRGFAFMGWATSEKSKTVYLKDKASVKNLLATGQTLEVYAIWQLKTATSYAIQYIRNDGSGSVRTVGFNGGVNTKLNSVAALGFARRGYDFVGWATSTENARNKKVWKPDMGIVNQPVANGRLLQVYAIWTLKPGYYAIRFNKNDGSGRWRELGYAYGVKTRLPTCVNGLGWTREGYEFAGWSLGAMNASAGGANWMKWKDDWAYVSTPTTAGKTISIYAMWQAKSKNVVSVSPVRAVSGGADADTALAPVAAQVTALVYPVADEDGICGLLAVTGAREGRLVLEDGLESAIVPLDADVWWCEALSVGVRFDAASHTATLFE